MRYFNTLTFFFLLLSFAATAQSVSTTPDEPGPGDDIQITFEAPSGLDAINPVIYIYTDKNVRAEDLELELRDDSWRGSHQIPEDAILGYISIYNKDFQPLPGNEGKGKPIVLFRDGAPLEGTNKMMARLYTFGPGPETDKTKAEEYWKQAEQEDPSQKTVDHRTYATIQQQNYPDAFKETLSADIEEILKDAASTEEDLLAAYHFSGLIEDSTLSARITAMGLENFQDGAFQAQELQTELREEKDLARKIELYQQLEELAERNPAVLEVANIGRVKGFLAYGIATELMGAERYDEAEKYLDDVSVSQQMSIYNNQAWQLAGEGIEGEATDVKRAGEMAAKTMDLLDTEMKKMEHKPDQLSPKRYIQILQNQKDMYGDTYALTLYRNGQYEKAWKMQEELAANANYANEEYNERLMMYAAKVLPPEEVEAQLTQIIAKGKATEQLREMHKKLFLENNTPEEMYSKYLSSLDESANRALEEEAKAKMISEDAPEFTLANLEGDSVSLSDLKGKTVVVDFWATWCGPCKSSFPGMKKTMDKYKDNDDVVFLYIDTWERGDEKERNATNFMKENDYPFTVLMDNDNEVVSAFGVSGIPTKFIIDGNGDIRFKSVGFSGEDKLIKELQTMIELVD